MKKLKLIYVLSAIILFSSSYIGCKKGEEDPFLSLIPRRLRVEGNWKVTRYETTEEFTSSFGEGTDKEFFDGTNVAYSTNGMVSNTSTLLLTFNFNKDGTYTMHRNEVQSGSPDAMITDEEGKWDFLSGVGETKNKENLVLIKTKLTIKLSNVINVTSYNTMTGTGQTYQVVSLKKDKMEMKWVDYTKHRESGSEDNHFGSMTLEQ